ncbi:unnamed protein product [Ilex paraguariensis]|uniref:Uncharacterized protein n=1 Tax=Ilex paraguariensis TaxID=185542 RepID=A0ABC8RX20_9AQUA
MQGCLMHSGGCKLSIDAKSVNNTMPCYSESESMVTSEEEDMENRGVKRCSWISANSSSTTISTVSQNEARFMEFLHHAGEYITAERNGVYADSK